jgi:calcium-dependent protein kinase
MGCAQSASAVMSKPAQPKKHLLREHLLVEKKKSFFEDYTVLEQVGKGSISNIYLVKKKFHAMNYGSASIRGLNETAETNADKSTEDFFALKEIDMDLVDPHFLKEMKNEITIMKTVDHPNILRAYEVYEDHEDGKEHISIIMEFCSGGDLSVRVPYTEAQARRIVLSTVEAINYLHHRGIMHRDLKFGKLSLAFSFEEDLPLIALGIP